MGGIDLSAHLSSPQFWWAVFSIFVINGLLSGDNAVLIALACRGLPRRERFWGMVIGAGVASVLLIVFTAVVSSLMQLPYLRFVSGLILVWIAIRLAGPADHDEGAAEAAKDLWRAVRLVVVADIVMSLDNVVAVAAIANGQYILLGLGLVISIPIVIGGSALVLALIERFPIVVWIGAAILGWVAGELLATDPMVQQHLAAVAHVDVGVDSRLFGATGHHDIRFGLDVFQIALGIAGAIVVVLGGLIWRAASGAGRTGEAKTETKKEHQPAE
ncbi:MAG TPA: TerC family protein [Xanthobacteraceae bacterium]